MAREGNGSGRASVRTSMVYGCEAVPVTVEASVAPGMERTAIVGMPDAAALEARERVRCAVRSAGFGWPHGAVTVNLAPSSLKKRGSGFDLAVAVAVLAATGQVDPALAAGRSFVGELSLGGDVRAVRGMYCHARAAAREGLELVCTADAAEAALAGAPALGLANLAELTAGSMPRVSAGDHGRPPAAPDFADVPGHEAAKRALQVAAAGGHGLLMVGPPGSCAAMLAARIPSLMPPLAGGERDEAAAVWSAAWEDPSAVLAGARPFRSPHHSATLAGLVGGGNPVAPGEASLAHGGVLFLEDVGEFPPTALQALRQPIDDGVVRIARADGTVAFPARFLLAASARPCPCGLLGHPGGACTCTENAVRAYQDRLCGPLRDRIDIRVDLTLEKPSGAPGASSADLRGPVEAAWEFRSGRRRPKRSSPFEVMWETGVTPAAERLLADREERFGASGRDTASALVVARTIADMEQSERVTEDHVAEALALQMR